MSRKVSAVIPSFNSARYVSDAVESVLNQTYSDIEIIVVDDGSTDDTSAVLESFGSKIRYFYKDNEGVSIARNLGINKATGTYIAFLDADDTWLPEKIERQVEAIGDQSEACHTAFLLGDEEMQVIGETRSERTDEILSDLFLIGNVVGTPSSVMISKQVLDRVGGFDPDLSLCADWDMWIRVAAIADFAYVDDPMIIYRQHGANMSNNATLLDTDSNLMFKKAFANPDVPEEIKAKKSKSLGKNYMVLAGTYFQAGMQMEFLRCAFRSLSFDPSQISYLLSYPLRQTKRRNA